MPEPSRLLPLIHKAVDAFRTTPGRRGHFVQLMVVSDVLVVGDLHGHVENFKRVLELADLNNHRKRHLVLQEVIHGPNRYPSTGGDQSHRMLDLLAALKCQYPARVHCLMGNHELSQWTERAITKNNEDLNQLFSVGVQTAYRDKADAIYEAYCQLIAALPVAIRTPNRIMLSHSLPAASRIDSWEVAAVLDEEFPAAAYKIGGGVHSVVWGRDTSAATVERYLAKVDCDLLISGHIPCEDGFLIPNERQLILDCKDDRACCCLVPTERPVTHQELVASVHRLARQTVQG
jgi:hypothetical protein